MRVPGLDRLVGRAGALEYRLPQLLDSLVVAEAGEHLARPLYAGHGYDAPLVLVLHRVAVGLGYLISRLLGKRPLLLIYTVHAVRVIGVQIYHSGESIAVMAQLLFLPFGDAAQRLRILILYVKAGERDVAPFDAHSARAREVKLLDQRFKEIKGFRLRADDDLLSGLHVHAGNGDKLCVFSEDVFIHDIPPYIEMGIMSPIFLADTL